MDLEALVIGLISMALFIVPIMYVQRKQKKQTGAFVNEFLTLAGQQQLTLTKYDTWNQNYAIGISEDQKRVFYVNKEEQLVQTALIDLNEVKSCVVARESREANGNKIIETIELRLSLRNPRPTEKSLEFYNVKKTLLLSGELQLAEKWRVLINNCTASLPATVVP